MIFVLNLAALQPQGYTDRCKKLLGGWDNRFYAATRYVPVEEDVI